MLKHLLILIIAQAVLAPAPVRFREVPIVITPDVCTAAKIGGTIPVSAIGEPVSAVTLAPPKWVPAAAPLPARCEVDGRIAPVDTAPTARAINFRVWLPAAWNHRAAQQGGGGMNGVVPDLRGTRFPIDGRSPAQWGFVTYGSDSGHQMGENEWTVEQEVGTAEVTPIQQPAPPRANAPRVAPVR